MKAVLFFWILISSAPVFAQDKTSDWFPLDVGNEWVYQHESLDTPANNPYIRRWQTTEKIVGILKIPEGMVVLRHIETRGDSGGGWLQTVYGRSNFLIRNSCLYFLDPQNSWDEQAYQLRPGFQTRLLAGDSEPQFCFPLSVGQTFGKDTSPGWVPSRVVGMGRDARFTPASVSPKAFDVVVHLVYADETHLWFEKGVGITGMWDWHNGTYLEYRVTLIRFSPARH